MVKKAAWTLWNYAKTCYVTHVSFHLPSFFLFPSLPSSHSSFLSCFGKIFPELHGGTLGYRNTANRIKIKGIWRQFWLKKIKQHKLLCNFTKRILIIFGSFYWWRRVTRNAKCTIYLLERSKPAKIPLLMGHIKQRKRYIKIKYI